MNNTIYGGTTTTPVPLVVVDQTHNPTSENAQSGKAVAKALKTIGEQYFDITSEGMIFLKPEYRGAYGFKLNDDDNDAPIVSADVPYAKSDIGEAKVGSKYYELPSEIIIPDTVNGIAVTSLAMGMFAYNERVKKIVLCNKVTKISDLFAYKAYSLESVENTNNITQVNAYAFAYTKIKKVDLPNLTTPYPYMFQECPYLERVNIGKVTRIPEGAFIGDLSLKYIEIASPVTTIGNFAFYECTMLKKIDNIVAPNVTTSIGKGAFIYCRPTYDWDSLTNCSFGENATPDQVGNYNPYKDSKNLFNSDMDFATNLYCKFGFQTPISLSAGTYTIAYQGEDAMAKISVTDANANTAIASADNSNILTFTLANDTSIKGFMKKGTSWTDEQKELCLLYTTPIEFTPYKNKTLSFFNQKDLLWGNEYLFTATTGKEYQINDGCLLWSTMGIYCSLNNIECDDIRDLLLIAKEKGWDVNNYTGGIYTQNYKDLLDALDLQYEVMSGAVTKEKVQRIFDAIAEGKYVECIVMGDYSILESMIIGGHAVALAGVTPQGELIIPNTLNSTWKFGEAKVIENKVPFNNLVDYSDFDTVSNELYVNAFAETEADKKKKVFAVILSKKEG